MRRFHRHSVWIDVFGALLLGVVLLGGAGYLLYHAGSVAEGVGRAALEDAGPAVSHRQTAGDAQWAPRPRGFASRGSAAGPLLDSRPRPSASGVQAPFSDDWREQATPDLTGPSVASSGGDPRSGDIGAASSGPPTTSPRFPGQRGSGGVQERRTGGSGWQAEAQRLAGRARALSRQLDQRNRSETESGETSSPQERASTSAAGRGASASGPGSPGDPDRRGDPGSPSSVPIDDHVYWLAIAGLLWGVWRLWGG